MKEKMIHKKLTSIEKKIGSSSAMNEENKEEILKLIEELKSELSQIETEKTDELASLDSMNKLEEDEDEGLIKNVFSEVSESLEEFEGKHPKLIQVLNSICTQLSNAGL